MKPFLVLHTSEMSTLLWLPWNPSPCSDAPEIGSTSSIWLLSIKAGDLLYRNQSKSWCSNKRTMKLVSSRPSLSHRNLISNFQLALMLVVVAAAAADRLENVYLPPVSAKTASGGGLLTPPAFGRISSSYGPPAAGLVPSQLYNAPSARTYSGHTGGAPVAILRFNNDNAGDGTYRFEWVDLFYYLG